MSRAARILEATTRQNERILTLLQRLDDTVIALEGVIRAAVEGRHTHDAASDLALAGLRGELERLRVTLEAAIAAQGRVKLWRYEGPVWVLVTLGGVVAVAVALGQVGDLAALVRAFMGR